MNTKTDDLINKWKVYFNEGKSYLTDREYLNYLLKESEKAINDGNCQIMRFII